MIRLAASLFLMLLSLPAAAQTPDIYDSRGPYRVVNRAEGPGCHIFRPADLGNAPQAVVLWGNGSGAMVPTYAQMLNHWASHGVIVVAAVTGKAGSGKPLLDCLDYVAAENVREGSPLKGRVDLDYVGASGHSLGGAGALMAGRDPRVTATAPIQPYIQNHSFDPDAAKHQHGPMLLLSGAADTVADPAGHQAPVFADANQPVVWAALAGASHNLPSTGDSGPYRAATTAWWLYQLMGDPAAAARFEGEDCGYCASPSWTVQRKTAPAAVSPATP